MCPTSTEIAIVLYDNQYLVPCVISDCKRVTAVPKHHCRPIESSCTIATKHLKVSSLQAVVPH